MTVLFSNLAIDVAVSGVSSAVVAWLVARTIVTRPNTHAEPETQQRVQCGVCGQLESDWSAGEDHINDIHNMVMRGQEAEAVLERVEVRPDGSVVR